MMGLMFRRINNEAAFQKYHEKNAGKVHRAGID